MNFIIFFLIIFLNTDLNGNYEIILPSNCNEPKVKYKDTLTPETNEEKLKRMDMAFLEALNNFDDCIINNGAGSDGESSNGSSEGSNGEVNSGSPSGSEKKSINKEFQSSSSNDVYGTEINENSNQIANQNSNSLKTKENGNIKLKSEKGKTDSKSNQVRILEKKDDNVLKKQILELCETFEGDDKRNCMEEYKKIN